MHIVNKYIPKMLGQCFGGVFSLLLIQCNESSVSDNNARVHGTVCNTLSIQHTKVNSYV